MLEALNPGGLTLISNEMAGTYLMSFDLKEPWITHLKYKIFEEKHSDLFAKQSVTADRILMLYHLDDIVTENIPKLNNELFGKYRLTRYAILYILRLILEEDNAGKKLINDAHEFIKEKQSREKFRTCIKNIVEDIIVDINAEVKELGEDFDYRSRLRDEKWVKELAQKVTSIYLKSVNRQRVNSFEEEWNKTE